MITQIFGVLIEKNPPFIVVDVNGIGYEISVPMSSYYLLPEINQKIKLLTHFIVKEDGHFLYGFVSEEERYIFRLLLKVSGIGAKIAIAILSGLSVKEIAATVELNESIKFQKIPGIGKKTAERLVLELKDKIKLNNINNINNINNMKKVAETINKINDENNIENLHQESEKNTEANQNNYANIENLLILKEEIIAALLALGYSSKECDFAVKNLSENIQSIHNVGDGIRFALKQLVKF